MNYEEQQKEPVASIGEEPSPQELAKENGTEALSEDYFDNSVFPHFWLCVPVALLLCWQFYDLFGERLFFYRVGASGMYGPVDILGPAWLLMPVVFIALLFFAFWNMRFAREGGDTKAQALRRGMLTMVGVFAVAAFVVWLLVLNLKWK